jgi:GNAT superfamily N-acetyltransferase
VVLKLTSYFSIFSGRRELPHTETDSTWTFFRSGMWRLFCQLSREGRRRYYGELIPVLHDAKAAVMGARDADCYYLVYIGTKEGSRGRGFAGKLLRDMIAKVSRQGGERGALRTGGVTWRGWWWADIEGSLFFFPPLRERGRERERDVDAYPVSRLEGGEAGGQATTMAAKRPGWPATQRTTRTHTHMHTRVSGKRTRRKSQGQEGPPVVPLPARLVAAVLTPPSPWGSRG